MKIDCQSCSYCTADGRCAHADLSEKADTFVTLPPVADERRKRSWLEALLRFKERCGPDGCYFVPSARDTRAASGESTAAIISIATKCKGSADGNDIADAAPFRRVGT